MFFSLLTFNHALSFVCNASYTVKVLSVTPSQPESTDSDGLIKVGKSLGLHLLQRFQARLISSNPILVPNPEPQREVSQLRQYPQIRYVLPLL
ncbi:hypothetical protein BJY00DRAFT_276764, partial [Aspergillus carlsbadensis]